MAAPDDAAPQPSKQADRPQNPRDRARRLYDCARHIEACSRVATVQETAREIALLALDLLAEARAEKAA